jgi:molybdopterin-containing oxidoreductase family membrane subunit
MWFERFVIIVTSLTRTMLPSSWHYYMPTAWDAATLIGSFGLFLTLFVLFCRYLPIVAMAEVKGALPEAHAGHAAHADHGAKGADHGADGAKG